LCELLPFDFLLRGLPIDGLQYGQGGQSPVERPFRTWAQPDCGFHLPGMDDTTEARRFVGNRELSQFGTTPSTDACQRASSSTGCHMVKNVADQRQSRLATWLP